MANELKNLFSPVRINKLDLKNRAVMPAMGTGFGKRDGMVSEKLLAYLERRAQGGAGLIITEVCAIDPAGKGFPNELCCYDDSFIFSLKQISRAIKKHGAASAIQLHHAGRETFAAVTGSIPEAPSAIPSAILNQPCEEMSIDRIREIVDAYANAAGRCQEAGFDAIEIHAAHGYLPGQFLSPFSNHRMDIYGRDNENRARFVIEILKAVRAKVGPDFCILIRVSADEMIKGGYDLGYMKLLAPWLVSAGADAIHCSVGVYSTPGNLSIASFDTEPGFNLKRAAAIKEEVSVPVIGVGRISDPRLADQAIARGGADLIAFGRQHLTDPDFLAKAERGAFEDIRFCLACNQGCIERLSYELKPVTCTINPECGREYKSTCAKVGTPKKVLVVGAGPAGLSAAYAAAGCGHQVSIFEREKEPGGQLLSASKPPNKKPYMDWVEWITRKLKELGVEINLGKEVTPQLIIAMKPELVVLSTGAMPLTPEIAGINSEKVCDARELLLGKVLPQSPAVVLGAGYVGMETADFLIAKGVSVTVLEMQSAAPVPKFTAHGYWLNHRLKKAGASLILGALVKRIETDGVIFEQAGEERRLEAAQVVKALGAMPEKSLEPVLQKLGVIYYVLGDAEQPRRLLEAVHEAYEIFNPPK